VGGDGEPDREREWYADGLRFSCTQCGNCCTGPPGAVWFDEEEGRAMAAHLGLDERVFYRRFARRLDGHWSLQERHREQGYDCVFLDRETVPGKAVCRLYEARPTQCRTWPFWPENLESKRTWHAVKRTTPCPGMDRGKLIPIEKIRIQRDAC
jgi:Fe-S-cluster containining protein